MQATKWLQKFAREEDGQTATEYMLLISVVVIALVAATYVFYNPFQEGVNDLGDDAKILLERGCLPGSPVLACPGARG